MVEVEPHPLGHLLRSLPHEAQYRYNAEVERQFKRYLFYSLAANRPEYATLFFPGGPPPEDQDWILSEARGAVDGAEYTEAARGKRCGHIFKHEEATYFCRTCTTDATCVLCQKCFEASDHDSHHVDVYLSEGSSGCCDCGDEEAWNRPMKCGIHTPLERGQDGNASATGQSPSPLPLELQDSIRRTIARIFDYMCDVFSCAPEHMRSSKHAESIHRDEELARLVADWYGAPGASDTCTEFVLILWNDEKHTVDEVQEQVARACSRRKSYGELKAREIDSVGRAVIEYSRDVQDLIKKAKILEQIKVTVTIRSSRDFFREQMCDTIVEWLTDISACSVGDDHNILMDTVCGEMLRQWRIGSNASNLQIGRQGFTDHQKTDNRLQEMREQDLRHRMMAAREQVMRARRDVQDAANAAGRRNAITIGQPTDEGTRTDDDDDEADETNDDDVDNDDNANDFIEELLQGTEAVFTDTGGMFVPATHRAIVTDTGELLATAPATDDTTREPSPAPRDITNETTDDSDADASMLSPHNDADELLSAVSPTSTSEGSLATPAYWLKPGKKVTESNANRDIPIEENFNKRVRIDFLILYDLRMWKTLRNNLRRLYIGTVIKVPQFKRVLGLRFAAIYRILAQLYLVADREPDHSIINLSLQMLTTPSITAEIIDRGNFCTRLLAILYTFFTKRKVGNPEDVDLTVGMNFEAGVITNRRVHHFFNDLRYMLEAKFTHQRLREDPDYLLQFLDILKLFQGMDSNLRAIGEHVPFETDAWMLTIVTIRDLARVIKLFAESFRWTRRGGEADQMYVDPMPMCRSIKEIAKTAILHSLGTEHVRFQGSEVSRPLAFKPFEQSEFEVNTAGCSASTKPVVDFVVEREAMSFHHPVHWALSWVIDEGKSMAKAQLQSQLNFTFETLQSKYFSVDTDANVPQLTPLQYQLALFDVPLRTMAWIAQVRAGMWVRNGLGLRHQMLAFRQVTHRELTSSRDIFLLQTALVVRPPEIFLANIIDRFHVDKLIRGNAEIPQDWEDHHLIDVAEDFVHLLTVLVSERTMLRPIDEDPQPELSQAMREIVHVLCFKPLPYSDLTDRITHGSTIVPAFDQILSTVAHFKPPEGLQDSGTFELKSDWYNAIDPYNYYYTKNQREESENAWKRNESKRTGSTLDDVVFEPQLKPIRTGLFTDLAAFTQTPLFGQVIWGMLDLALHPTSIGKLPPNRVEAFLPLVLYLILIAIAEDTYLDVTPQPAKSFIDATLLTEVAPQASVQEPSRTILRQLVKLKNVSNLHETSKPKIRRIIQRLREKRPVLFARVVEQQGLPLDETTTDPSKEVAAREQAERKRKAQERNARVMASFKKQQNDFMSQQLHDDDLEEWDDLAEDVEMRDIDVRPTWSFPRDTCIFCQEETDDSRLYGSLVYINKSKIFRDTNLSDQSHIQEVGMVPLSYDRQTETLRPYGIARQNVERVMRVNDSGEGVMHERRGLGKGWNPDQTSAGNVATSCGHLMHLSCFETFNAATKRRQGFQIARNHPERLNLKEFVCPLCKALGNTFLPIVFKPKELMSASELAAGSGNFDEWLVSRTPFLASDTRAQDDKIYTNESTKYRKVSLQQQYAASLVPEPSPATTRGHLAMPSFLGGSTAPSALREQQTIQNSEPFAAYKRLKETILANRLDPYNATQTRPSSEYSPADVLAGTLGSSISSTEIALRGQESALDSTFFLDRVADVSVAHLRILSETCSTAAANVAMGGDYATKKSVLTQRMQLFGPSVSGGQSMPYGDLVAWPALFNDDVFEFFTRATVFLSPYLISRDGEKHIMRLCLLAEVVKVVIAYFQDFTAVAEFAKLDHHESTDEQGQRAETAKQQASSEGSQSFSAFVQTIIDRLVEPLKYPHSAVEFMGDVEVNPNERSRFDDFLRGSITRYTLPFLRKCLLLLHIRDGVDFAGATAVDPDGTEIDRITQVLGLPSIDRLLETCISSDRVGSRLQELISFWISHWRVTRLRASSHMAGKGSESNPLLEQRDTIISDIFSPNSAGSFADTDLHIPAPPGAYVEDPLPENEVGFRGEYQLSTC